MTLKKSCFTGGLEQVALSVFNSGCLLVALVAVGAKIKVGKTKSIVLIVIETRNEFSSKSRRSLFFSLFWSQKPSIISELSILSKRPPLGIECVAPSRSSGPINFEVLVTL